MSAFFVLGSGFAHHLPSWSSPTSVPPSHRTWANVRPVLLVRGGNNWLCHFHPLGVLLRDLGACRMWVGLASSYPVKPFMPFCSCLPSSCFSPFISLSCVCVSPSLSLSGTSEVSPLAPKSLWNPSSLKPNLVPLPLPSQAG